MGSNFFLILALSPLLPSLVGLIIFKKVERKFHPFIFAMILSLITEVAVAIVLRIYHTNHIPYIIYAAYTIINILLYLWFFYSINIIKSLKVFYLLVTISIVVWFACFSIKTSIEQLFISNLFCSFIIIIFSVELLSRQIFETKQNLHKSFPFLMSAGALLFNSFFIFLVSIWFLGIDDYFKTKVFSIQKFINAATYIIFAISLLCLPRVKTFLK